MTREDARADLKFHRSAKAKLQAAYEALAEGRVKSYAIGTRTLTYFDLPTISKEISGHTKAIAELEAVLHGGSRRKAVGIVLRDW